MAISQRRLAGCILGTDPLVTFSKRAPALGLGLGLVGHRPDLAETGRSFHILTLAWTHEGDWHANRLRQELDAFAAIAPEAKFLVVANTAAEHGILLKHGIEAICANVLCLADTARFDICPPPDDAVPVDAVYVAGFQPFKRHELACEINRLLLLSWPPTVVEAIAMRQKLPTALFGNYEALDGAFAMIDGVDYCRQLARASVGLCLSADEGPMRASIEYMLCGLPVLTTPSRGGRIEMLSGPYLSVVEPDPVVIAAAVASLAQNRPDPVEVRAHVLRRIASERVILLDGINAWLASHGVHEVDSAILDTIVSKGVWRTRPEQDVFGVLAKT